MPARARARPGPFLESFGPARQRLMRDRETQVRGSPGAGRRELGGVDVAPLGVGDDGDPQGVAGRVPRRSPPGCRSRPAAARRVGQDLGRGQADPQARVGARPQADGDDLEVVRRGRPRLEQVADGGDQVPAVSRRRGRPGERRGPSPEACPTRHGRAGGSTCRSTAWMIPQDWECVIRRTERIRPAGMSAVGLRQSECTLGSWIRGLDPSAFLRFILR